MKDYPETKEEWWKFVDDNWEDLKILIETFRLAEKNLAQVFNITEKEKVFRKDILDLSYYEKLKKEKDDRLLDVFNQTYWGIPESISCWDYNGFGTLCDLCLKGYVLEE